MLLPPMRYEKYLQQKQHVGSKRRIFSLKDPLLLTSATGEFHAEYAAGMDQKCNALSPPTCSSSEAQSDEVCCPRSAMLASSLKLMFAAQERSAI